MEFIAQLIETFKPEYKLLDKTSEKVVLFIK